MAQQWDNNRKNTIVDYQPGGPGNSWLIFDTQGELTAPSGGGRSFESKWGRSDDGASDVIVGTNITSDRERFTFDMSARFYLTPSSFLRTFANCLASVRVRQKCGDIRDLTSYQAIIGYIDAGTTSKTFSEPLSTNSDTPGSDEMETFSMSAADEYRILKLAAANISGTKFDVAINKIRSIGYQQCNGDCGLAYEGTENWIAVTDADASPGYASSSVPYFAYTLDKGATWTTVNLTNMITNNATDTVKVGANIVVVGPNNTPQVASWQDILDGVATPFSNAAGDFTTGSPNPPSYLGVFPDGTVLGVGVGGYIWKSTDAGLSWTSVDAASTTTEDLNSVAIASDTVAFIGGTTGTILKWNNGVISTVTWTDENGATVTDTINVVAVPPKRDAELFIGTSAGNIYRTRANGAATVVATALTFQQAGNGSIDDLQFTGYRGNVMFILQSDAGGSSRTLRDLSGGAAATDVEVISTFDSPLSNAVLNSIGVANLNFAIGVGEVDGTYAAMLQYST